MECMAKLGGPILFASTAHAGQINPLLSIASELSRRGVPDLWFASTYNRRAEVERAAKGRPIHFVSCGINDRTKELVEDPAVYESFAEQGPMGIANPFGSLARYSDAATAIFCYSIFGLEYPFPVPRHLHFLGAMVPSPAPATQDCKNDVSRWLDGHRSVIYVCLGTLAQLSEVQIITLITAFKRLTSSHHILWKLPDAQQALLPPRDLLPTNIRIEHWIPSQLGVLAHPNVRVFLTHGGGNGFHEGIYFGKPLLVMPFWLDCFDFAVRAVDSGVGLALDRPPAFTADEVAMKLERLLNVSRFHERAGYWGEQLRKAGGVHRAADLVWTMLDSVNPSVQ
jgi:UDP:flavonoid glycosyltransferase YjiC (YdhE family)